jgi:hypothetical protein
MLILAILLPYWSQSMSKTLDRVDRRILDTLQADARISNQELAKRVGCRRRPAGGDCGGWKRKASSQAMRRC